jgi:hypothetical protein
MEQDPFKNLNNGSATHGILCISWHPKVHFHVHKNLPTAPTQGHMNSGHTISPYCFKIHFNIILPSMPIYAFQVSSYIQITSP